MNQTSPISDHNARIASRTTTRLVGALVLGGSLLVAACGTGAISSGGPAASATASASASPAIAGALQSDFVNVVSNVSPSVVIIETTTGLGSGVVFDAKGDILTNDHVVAGSTKFTVTLADGQKLPGTLVGTYAAGDLAVIHVTGTNLQPATFGDSSKLAVGDIVLAVGNPLGFQGSVSQGIVSALDRSVAESKAVTLPNVIQTRRSGRWPTRPGPVTSSASRPWLRSIRSSTTPRRPGSASPSRATPQSTSPGSSSRMVAS